MPPIYGMRYTATMAHHNETLEAFEQRLRNEGKTYEALSPIGEQLCHIRFSGVLQQHAVIWNATLLTLAEYQRKLAITAPLQQFIEIDETDGLDQRVTIALAVDTINEPTIHKAIIMLRQYKRLNPGRHNYGPLYNFNKKNIES